MMLRLNATIIATIAVLMLESQGASAGRDLGHHCDEGAKPGGVLHFVVASGIPSFDAHRETSHGMIQSIRPFYSLLVRVDPCELGSLTSIVCDLCEGTVPAPTRGGTVYTFRIRQGVRFHDGTPLTSADIKATFDKIIFPPEGVPSARRSYFSMVESITTPDDYSIQFKLKYPSSAFVVALAMPFNFIYSKRDLETHGPDWHTKNINGTGPFVFARHELGYYVEGLRNPDYHFEGRPFLDGYRAFVQPDMVMRARAIFEGTADIEFRGFPRTISDTLVGSLGKRISVQESDWNCVIMATPNHKVRPFDDPRVRRALTLGIDRWGESHDLAETASVQTVGGLVFPQHPLAASESELTALAGYGRDIEASRARARRLLAEAGYSNLTFELNNQANDHPYRIVGSWLVEQWSKIGLRVSHRVQPLGPFYETLRRRGDFQVSIDFNCQSVVNPLVDVSKYLGSAGNNYGQYKDATLEELYRNMQRADDDAEQYALMRKFEHRVLDDASHAMITLWWRRIIAYRSYVKGWEIAPSHYLNQHLDQVWLDR